MTLLRAALLVAGMTATTVVSRALFLFPRRPWTLPPRLRVALRHAPAAALAAVVAPELLLATSLGAPPVKIGAALAAGTWYLWRRDIVGTIVSGMAAYWLLRLFAGA